MTGWAKEQEETLSYRSSGRIASVIEWGEPLRAEYRSPPNGGTVMRLITASILCTAAFLPASALAQQDYPADPSVEYDQVTLPPAASETALEFAMREGWSDESDTDDLPLYVREVALPETRTGAGYALHFCGPRTPDCP